MGPLAKIWQVVGGARKGQEEKLIEQTDVLVGQENSSCLYEWRVNILEKIIKCVKKYKEHL